MLNDNEKKKYETISKLVNGEITRKEASNELNLSLKQIDRLKKTYLNKGESGFIHGNRGKENKNKIDEKIIEELEELYLTDFYDFNFEQFYEKKILGNYNISYDAMLKRFTNDDIISPFAHKKTVKKYNEKMKNVIEKEEKVEPKKVELFKSRIIAAEKAHIRRANNLFVFGQEIQMDACQGVWFGKIPSYLHLVVDKATKKVLFGWFEYEEITRGYFVLLFNTIINYGIPAKIKTDNRSSFSANNAKNKDKKTFLTQFGKVCERLNIVLETSSIPTAKANVERENGTFKKRLAAELRQENITTIDEANDYLNKVFIPYMNKKFSYAIDEKTSVMRKNTYTEEELKLIISERTNKIIDNASSIYYNYNYYVPVDPNTGDITCFSKGTECTFIINYDGDYWGKIENHYYQLLKLENRDSIMKKESKIEQPKKEHQKFIPPANHPWRKNMMLKH